MGPECGLPCSQTEPAEPVPTHNAHRHRGVSIGRSLQTGGRAQVLHFAYMYMGGHLARGLDPNRRGSAKKNLQTEHGGPRIAVLCCFFFLSGTVIRALGRGKETRAEKERFKTEIIIVGL